jgi:multidrug efflux system membrane fusion protein
MKRFLVVASISILLAAFYYFRMRNGAGVAETAAPEPVLAVDADKVRIQSLPVSLEASGEVVAEHVVQVRPQVTGMLKDVFINEGQRVVVGQRLFLIEPAPFEAAVASAKAAWESADGKLQRAVPLAKQGYVSSQDLITARAAADQALAAYKQATINLKYTDIRAPLAGRTGILGEKSGNVVAPTDATPLVTINETRPIQVQFTVPQQSLLTVREHQAISSLKVSVTTEDGSRILDEGTLVFVDNAVNLRTGTVLLKARTPNAQEQLWPGQYVTVHLQLAVESRAIVIPQTAVQTGQSGTFVYVLIEGKAQSRSVKVDREVGPLAVIAAGLKGDEEVVTRVPRGLRAGISAVANADSKP